AAEWAAPEAHEELPATRVQALALEGDEQFRDVAGVGAHAPAPLARGAERHHQIGDVRARGPGAEESPGRAEERMAVGRGGRRRAAAAGAARAGSPAGGSGPTSAAGPRAAAAAAAAATASWFRPTTTVAARARAESPGFTVSGAAPAAPRSRWARTATGTSSGARYRARTAAASRNVLGSPTVGPEAMVAGSSAT